MGLLSLLEEKRKIFPSETVQSASEEELRLSSEKKNLTRLGTI